MNFENMWTDRSEEERLQLIRNYKLQWLREARKPLLSETDMMAKNLIIGIRSDVIAVKDYIIALRDITNTLRSSSDEANPDYYKGTVNLDSIDLESFVWPVKP